MDTLKKIERLFERARQADTPVFHVSDRVIADIRPPEVIPLMPLSVVAGLSAAAAVLFFFMAVNAWTTVNSPNLEMVASLQELSSW